MICNFHTCTVCQCDDHEIPLPWMQDSEGDDVDKNIDEKFYKWVDKYNYSSPNWIVENEIDSKNGIFVNLEKNPESFTGYHGQHIWNAIYYENCFKALTPDQLCREEKTLYKIISGLHANINIHLSKNYFDIHKNISIFNYTMLNERLIKNPDRINNLFFLYSLLLKAFYKAENIIKNYNYYTGNITDSLHIENVMKEIYAVNNDMCEDCLSNEYSATFQNFDKFLNFNPLKLDELKSRFRNISQIIDCVSCQKCKLHGKLQIYGLATMLKILFCQKEPNLKRNELISFINFVGKVSKSIEYLYIYINTKNNNVKIDERLNLELFLVYMIPVIFFLFMLNRYFFKNKNVLERNLITRKQKNFNLNDAFNCKKNPNIIQYLSGEDNDFIIDKKNN